MNDILLPTLLISLGQNHKLTTGETRLSNMRRKSSHQYIMMKMMKSQGLPSSIALEIKGIPEFPQ